MRREIHQKKLNEQKELNIKNIDINGENNEENSSEGYFGENNAQSKMNELIKRRPAARTNGLSLGEDTKVNAVVKPLGPQEFRSADPQVMGEHALTLALIKWICFWPFALVEKLIDWRRGERAREKEKEYRRLGVLAASGGAVTHSSEEDTTLTIKDLKRFLKEQIEATDISEDERGKLKGYLEELGKIKDENEKVQVKQRVETSESVQAAGAGFLQRVETKKSVDYDTLAEGIRSRVKKSQRKLSPLLKKFQAGRRNDSEDEDDSSEGEPEYEEDESSSFSMNKKM